MPRKNDYRGIGSMVLELSEEMSDGFDLFDYPAKDTSLLAGKTIIHHLSTAINENNNVFEFVIPSENHEYTFLPLTRLEGLIEIKKNDNTPIVVADLITPVNLLATSMWRQVECEVNGVQVADLTSPTYHYKAYLENHLSYGREAKEGHLRCSLYCKETPGQEETLGAANTAYTTKNSWITADGKINFSTLVHLDFFDSARFLIPGSHMKLKFTKNEDKMILIAQNNTYKVLIKELYLTTRKMQANSQIVNAHLRTLQGGDFAKYPLAQSKIKTYTVNTGISSTTLSGIFLGKLPRSCIVAFVKASGFNGTITSNPYLFKHFDLSYLALTVNGVPTPAKPFQPNFATGNCIREYRHFLDNVGVSHENTGIDISLEDYKNNTAVFAFDLGSPDLCNNYHNHIDYSGAVNLDLQWRNPLPENIVVIIYATYNEFVKIGRDGEVIIEQ